MSFKNWTDFSFFLKERDSHARGILSGLGVDQGNLAWNWFIVRGQA